MTFLRDLLENIDMSSEDNFSNSPDDVDTNIEMGQDDYDAQDEATHSGLVTFFMEHENPTDEEVHQLAMDMGMEPEELEEQIYSLLHATLNGVGKHNDVPDDEFDAEQLARGIEVESEHTNNKLVAKMIAKDHLSELPDYYTRLDQMEKTGRIEDDLDTGEDTDTDEDNGNEIDSTSDTEFTFQR